MGPYHEYLMAPETQSSYCPSRSPGASLGHSKENLRRQELHLLWTIAVVLLILWLLGLVSSYTLGGFIHILLVLAIIVILIRVIQGRRVV